MQVGVNSQLGNILDIGVVSLLGILSLNSSGIRATSILDGQQSSNVGEDGTGHSDVWQQTVVVGIRSLNAVSVCLISATPVRRVIPKSKMGENCISKRTENSRIYRVCRP